MVKFKLSGLECFVSTVTCVQKFFWEAPSPPPDEGVGLGIVEPPSSDTLSLFVLRKKCNSVLYVTAVLCTFVLAGILPISDAS